MAYYGQKGDFYTGATGYYVGDPGFLGNLFGDVANIVRRQVVPAAVGYVKGGYAGAARALLSSRGGGGGGTLPAVRYQHMRGGMRPVAMGGGPPMISGAGMAALPVATRAAAGAMIRKGARKALTTAGAALPGILQTQFGTSEPTTAYHYGSAYGRRRRMNVCNPRALRRAIRRTHGFAKLAMRIIHIVHPRKKGRFGGFKKRRTHK
jgi:hypothetical protein